MSTADSETDSLRDWYSEYQADDWPGPRSPSLASVTTDLLNHADIAKKVHSLVRATTVKSGFCNGCTRLLVHWPTPQWRPFIPCFGKPCPTIEMEAGARAGCRFCALLFSKLYQTGLLNFFREVERRLFILKIDATPSLTIAATSEHVQQLWVDYPEKFTRRLPVHSPVSLLKSTIQPPNSNLWIEPIEIVHTINTWIGKCDQPHEDCSSVIGVNDRPSRLVSVSGTSIRLVNTATLPTMPRYATLSYCWGTLAYSTLQEDNLSLFLEFIPIETLPKTLRDAIDVTRKLNIGYIWIDALCIIQGNRNDWLTESAKMESIYGGSYLNIAAASAVDVSEGLFLKLPFYNGGFFARTGAMPQGSTIRNFHSAAVAKEALQDYHLAKRAWAVQEKLLSPRTVYFGDCGLSWECRHAFYSEFLPEGVADLKYKSLLPRKAQPWNWIDVVTLYTKANLTIDSDRLPALSGIAARQHQITGGTYLAGLWKDSLFEQLTWKLRKSQSAPKLRPCWRAPTWSWASVDGEAFWRPIVSKKVTRYVQIIDAWTELSGLDPFGAVCAGELSIACNIILRGNFELTMVNGLPVRGVRLEKIPALFQVNFDCTDDESTTLVDNTVYFVPMYSGPTGDLVDKPTRREKDTKHKTSTAKTCDDDSPFRDVLAVHGLVLRCYGGIKGRFSRVGFFAYDNMERGESKEYADLMELVEGRNKTVAEDVCEAVVPYNEDLGLRFIIRIV